jgi:putative nucleotidyltransferase with HDIG domain
MDTLSQVGALHNKLSVERLDQLICGLNGLVAWGPVARSVLELLTASDGGASDQGDLSQELGDLITLDPAMTVGVLSLANRSGGPDVFTVSDAIEKLGFDVVRAALLAGQGFIAPAWGLGDETRFDNEAFSRHCLAVAIAAEKLAELGAASIDPRRAFICGLLHDLGKLVLDRTAPKSYRRAIDASVKHHGNLSEYEREFVGVDHAVAGLHLARQWRLGGHVEAVAWLSHQPSEAIPASISDAALVEIVGLADTIARENGVGFSGNFKFIRSSAQIALQMGLSEDIPQQIAAELDDEVNRRLSGLQGDSPSQNATAHQRAVCRANTELGKLNRTLRRRADEHQSGAEALRKLKKFAASISPDALLPETLVALGDVVADVLSITPSASAPIIAYCCAQDGHGVSLIVSDRSDWPAIHTVRANSAFDGTVCSLCDSSTTTAMSALLADVGVLSQWIDPGIYAHHRFVCQDRWVGGVLSPADAPGQGRMDESMLAIGDVLALTLAMVRGQSRATRLSEQLAGAGEVLAATQETLAETRTLAAMGEMAAGAGHELNNPLAVISGRAQIMRDRASTPEEQKTWTQITNQAQRISDIITDMMDFASPRRAAPDIVDVGGLGEEIVKTFAASEEPKLSECEISVDPLSEPLRVIADITQLRSAFREVVANAALSGKDPRKVRISAAGSELNDTVLISISDDGPGMTPQTLASVFTPFFSAQEAGRRVGLGLPRAQKYIINNGGGIWIETSLGEGTTVFIELPRAPQ